MVYHTIKETLCMQDVRQVELVEPGNPHTFSWNIWPLQPLACVSSGKPVFHWEAVFHWPLYPTSQPGNPLPLPFLRLFPLLWVLPFSLLLPLPYLGPLPSVWPLPWAWVETGDPLGYVGGDLSIFLFKVGLPTPVQS